MRHDHLWSSTLELLRPELGGVFNPFAQAVKPVGIIEGSLVLRANEWYLRYSDQVAEALCQVPGSPSGVRWIDNDGNTLKEGEVKPMTTQEVWIAAEPLFEAKLEGSSRGLIKSVQAKSLDGKVFTIAVPNPTVASMLESRCHPTVVACVCEAAGCDLEVKYEVDEALRNTLSEEVAATRPDRPTTSSQFAARSEGLNPAYNFGNFLVFDCNRMAYSAAQQVTGSPGQVYNPLFIHSKAGLGKTHVLQAIGNMIGDGTIYVTAEDFVNEFKEALRRDEHGRDHTKEFRNRYRHLRCLLADDLAFLTGLKGGGSLFEDEFFHTMNSILMNGGQVVVAAEQPPKALGIANDRLRSRLEQGLVVVIGVPDVETRRAVLEAKVLEAASAGICISPEILGYVARKIAANFRTIIGAFNKLCAHLSLGGGQLTEALVDDLLADLSSAIDCKVFTAREIIGFCAERFNLSVEDLTGTGRTKDVAWARQVTVYAIRTLVPDLSLSDIGSNFRSAKKGKEQKDHSMVLYAYNQVRDRIAESQEALWFVNQLLEELRAA